VYVYFVLFSFIIKHLDARTIKITSPPGEVIKPNSFKLVEDEGMPTHGRSFIKGRLYIKFEVGPLSSAATSVYADFPWCKLGRASFCCRR